MLVTSKVKERTSRFPSDPMTSDSYPPLFLLSLLERQLLIFKDLTRKQIFPLRIWPRSLPERFLRGSEEQQSGWGERTVTTRSQEAEEGVGLGRVKLSRLPLHLSQPGVNRGQQLMRAESGVLLGTGERAGAAWGWGAQSCCFHCMIDPIDTI